MRRPKNKQNSINIKFSNILTIRKYHKIFRLIFIVSLGLNFVNTTKAQTIPNSDFENWQHLIYYDSAIGWSTNNTYPTSPTEVISDTIAFHGNYAMKLINYYTYRVWAQIKFPITTHPLNLIGYLKCNLSDSTDTVSIKIILLNNGLLVDSGMWFGFSSISEYIKVIIPISQNISIIDSAIIIITGGNHLTNNQLSNGTSFWVDYLSLNFNNGFENEKKNESQFTVFPNPASQYVTIEFTGEIQSLASIKLYNTIGKVITIENEKLLNSNKQYNIDLSFLPASIYFLKFETNQVIEFKKIIKQ